MDSSVSFDNSNNSGGDSSGVTPTAPAFSTTDVPVGCCLHPLRREHQQSLVHVGSVRFSVFFFFFFFFFFLFFCFVFFFP